MNVEKGPGMLHQTLENAFKVSGSDGGISSVRLSQTLFLRAIELSVKDQPYWFIMQLHKNCASDSNEVTNSKSYLSIRQKLFVQL